MIKGWKIVPIALIAVGTIVLLGECGRDEPTPAPTNAAQTSFPDLATATGEPTLPGLTSANPQPGAVEELTGPFDDRFEFTDLQVVDGTVAGKVTVTSDVSALLDLQVLAGFYDGEGEYLGSARFDQHTLHEHGGQADHAGEDHEHEPVEFSIDAPAKFRAQAVSAAVGVPVLVNE